MNYQEFREKLGITAPAAPNRKSPKSNASSRESASEQPSPGQAGDTRKKGPKAAGAVDQRK
jgi:hypothetical protein